MAQVSEMLIVGLSMLFAVLADAIGQIDVPKFPKLSQAASNASVRATLRAVDAETVSETEIIER